MEAGWTEASPLDSANVANVWRVWYIVRSRRPARRRAGLHTRSRRFGNVQRAAPVIW
jgi:hypothetical protein